MGGRGIGGGGRGRRTMNHYSPSRGDDRKRARLDPERMELREIVTCSRRDDFLGAKTRLEEMMSQDIHFELQVYLSVLTMCGGAFQNNEEEGGHYSPAKDAEVPQPKATSTERRELASRVFEYMAEKKVEIPEPAYTMLIRCCCLDGALDEGLRTLDELRDSGRRVKLRSLSPLIQLACREARLDVAFRLKDLAANSEITMSETDHAALLAASREVAQLEEMALDFHAPSRSVWNCVEEVMVEKGYRARRDAVVSETGKCLACGVQLASIDLEPNERAKLLGQIDRLVISVIKDGVVVDDPSTARKSRQWNTFKKFLEKHEENPYDAIVDGANVGFYSTGVSVDFRHIDLVLRHCLNLGKKTLVVLHSRHLAEDRLSPEALDFVKSWRRGGHLYSCNVGNNDDWYWLYAAVRGGEKAILVSNDEMRDHHFGMVSRRSFLVWKERHLTKFTFKNSPSSSRQRSVHLSLPLPYSTRMQKDAATGAWHIPAQESFRELDPASSLKHQNQILATPVVAPKPESSKVRWLCLSPPTNGQSATT